MTLMLDNPEDCGRFMSLYEMNESLIQSVREGNIDQVRELLQKGADVNARYYLNRGNWEILGGEDVNVCLIDVDNAYFDTAVLLASRLHNWRVVSELLKHETVDVNVKDHVDGAFLCKGTNVCTERSTYYY